MRCLEVLSVLVLAFGTPAGAAVSPDVAAMLSTTLTPVGAERDGNADGTIPAWTGGLAQQEAGPRADTFATERPLFSITASTLPRYAARLPEGAKALFMSYPDYRMDVYPTHRTAAAPQAVYDAIRRNAISARAAPEGITSGITGAAGGIPFPIPHDGAEGNEWGLGGIVVTHSSIFAWAGSPGRQEAPFFSRKVMARLGQSRTARLAWATSSGGKGLPSTMG